MSGTKILLDTNAVLYFLAGDETLADFLDGKSISISIITELELLSFDKLTASEVRSIKSYIDSIEVLNLNELIKEETIQLRRRKLLKLPDAIIAATAKTMNLTLLTADQQFSSVDSLNVIIYEK